MGLPTSDLNSVFWLSLAGILSAMIGLCLKSCYKSKCSEFSFCGIKIKRDIETEKEEDIESMRRGKSEDHGGSPKNIITRI